MLEANIKLNVADHLAEALNKALIEKAHFTTISKLHEKLLEHLQGKSKGAGEYKHPAPHWDLWPIARDFFTQVDPVVTVGG